MENNSLDQLNSYLNFMTEVPGYPFSVSWESGNYGRVHSDGSVDCEGVPENGELVELKAILSCYEQTWEEVFWVRICEAEEDELQNQLQNAVEKAAADAEYEDSFYLPDRTGEMQIIWQEKVDDYSPVIFLIFILMGVMQWVLPDQEVRKKLEERDWQLRLTYPEFISKLVLLLGAGLPVRAVIVRMASDYQKKKEAGTFNYAYEELLLTCRELNSGVAEVQAYEHFGQRCRLPQYRKCMTLLTANLKKGSSGLLDTLRAEAKDAFQERKHLAREEGEKAGTRLLLPMMMTLTVVMVLILVPACFSFSGM